MPINSVFLHLEPANFSFNLSSTKANIVITMLLMRPCANENFNFYSRYCLSLLALPSTTKLNVLQLCNNSKLEEFILWLDY